MESAQVRRKNQKMINASGHKTNALEYLATEKDGIGKRNNTTTTTENRTDLSENWKGFVYKISGLEKVGGG